MGKYESKMHSRKKELFIHHILCESTGDEEAVGSSEINHRSSWIRNPYVTRGLKGTKIIPEASANKLDPES